MTEPFRDLSSLVVDRVCDNKGEAQGSLVVGIEGGELELFCVLIVVVATPIYSGNDKKRKIVQKRAILLYVNFYYFVLFFFYSVNFSNLTASIN